MYANNLNNDYMKLLCYSQIRKALEATTTSWMQYSQGQHGLDAPNAEQKPEQNPRSLNLGAYAAHADDDAQQNVNIYLQGEESLKRVESAHKTTFNEIGGSDKPAYTTVESLGGILVPDDTSRKGESS